MRKLKPEKRKILPDPIYNSRLVARTINMIMYAGKKGLAEKILYGAFQKIGKKTNKDPLEIFNKALDNVMPSIELKVRRIAGANCQVPTEVSPERRVTLGLRWIITYARLRKEKGMQDKLVAEIIDASNNTGASVKKREDTHKMAEANKAFAYLRF